NDEPRRAFLARAPMLRQGADSSGLPGRTLGNRVVPLEGIALPTNARPGYNPFSAMPKFPTAPAAVPAVQVSIPAVDRAAPGAPATLPSNPPVDISQQMLDALDKYARMQQQRNEKRGSQLDLAR